jgi:serine/threonine-protein kinase
MAAPEPIAEEEEPSWGLSRGDDIDPSLVVIEPLGGGSRYEVLRAWDRELFCDVAVKVIRPNRVEDPRALEGFDREIALTARFVHPNLVRLLRFSTRPPRPYIVLEYITAQTLADHLAAVGPVSVPEMCLLGIRMCSALHYLHANQVLHLDVKPDNLTLGDPPRLLDMGLAHTAAGPLKLRRSMGTPAYMPPEQCTHGQVVPQSDLYALGVTLYEGTSGVRPFDDGDHDSEVRERRYPQLVGEAPPLKDVAVVPDLLNEVVMACLEKDPRGRPASAVALATDLQKVLETLRVEELYAWPKGLRVQPR